MRPAAVPFEAETLQRRMPMSSDLIETEVIGPVGLITLNRPEKRNALSAALIVELGEAIEALDAQEAVRAMVLTGADPAFSAGFDLRNLGTELRKMYDQIGDLIGHEAWRVENRWSKSWIQERFNSEQLAAEADAIIERGSSQS